MKKIDIRIIAIIVLTILLIGIIILYNQTTGTKTIDSRQNGTTMTATTNSSSFSKIQTSGEIESALTEEIPLHATYYYSSIQVEENQLVSKGDTILTYTNGETLVAPYDCIITSISIPEEGEQCTNSHKIEISANQSLQISFTVSETNVSKLAIGNQATIFVGAIEETFQGNITKISNNASNGKFTVVVEFENNGNIKLGMSATVEIAIE